MILKMNVRRKDVMKIILVIIYLILTVSGLVLMKKGGNPGSILAKDGNITLGMSLVSLLGLICYICSFLIYTRIVVMFDLSYIMPICVGIIQIAILVASYLVLKEEISKQGIIGASLIIIGIIVMNLKFNKT